MTDCPAQPKFDLVSHTFCPRGNIALKYSGIPELVDNQCFAKCSSKPSPFRNNVDEDGYNDWSPADPLGSIFEWFSDSMSNRASPFALVAPPFGRHKNTASCGE